MNRRQSLGFLVNAGVGITLGPACLAAVEAPRTLPVPSPSALPLWRGFNLLEMFNAGNARPFVEKDFALIADLGFDFVRLPLDYRIWTDPKDWTVLRDDRLKWVDEAVGFARTHGIHVQLSFHRAPGYTVAAPAEPKSVWKDAEALEVCAAHWSRFAERFKGVPNQELSFNPFNEPANVQPGPHKVVIVRLLDAIRAKDSERLVVCDGRDWATKPPTELVGLRVAAATRGYAPFHLTHYRANWVEGSDKWPRPTYPLKEGKTTWDKTNLERDQVAPWKALEAKGVGVMVGEFGSHNKTPHEVVIPWMRDCLSSWKSAGWGWALWNFRGNFGILDSDRPDVAYESWKGHKLDRAMLELLKSA